MTNLLKHNYFVRLASYVVALAGVLGCGSNKSDQNPTPSPTAPLPTAGIAGQRVALTPLELVAAEEILHIDTVIAGRRAALDKSDSIIGALLAARAPEVTWVGPAELRHIARRAIPIAADPDQLGTPFLRASNVTMVPDPLRSQLRTLVGLVGGRYVLIPAGLVFRRTVGPAGRPTGNATGAVQPSDGQTMTAELSLVMVDARTGQVGWRTTARAQADDPWLALTRAVKSLTPGLP